MQAAKGPIENHERIMNPLAPVAHQPSIVPSKNALRALRRLALSTPVLVVGTIGSVCGIATLNHEVNRKVRLAEQALESKRVIRSLSNGRGAAQLNAMFQAAERGEDFTLGTKGTRKRRRKNTSTRSFSAVAIEEPADRTDDLNSAEARAQLESQHTPSVHNLVSVQQQTRRSNSETTHVGQTHPSLDLESPDIPLPRKALPGRVTIRPGRSIDAATTHTKAVHSVAVEKILETSKAQHKMPNHGTNSRPRRQDQTEVDGATTSLQKWSWRPFGTIKAEQSIAAMPSEPAVAATFDKSGADKTPEMSLRADLEVIERHSGSPDNTQADKTLIPWLPLTLSSSQSPIAPQGGLLLVDVPEWASNREYEISGRVPSDVAPLDEPHFPEEAGDENGSKATGRKRSVLRSPKVGAAFLLPYVDDEITARSLRKRISIIHNRSTMRVGQLPVEAYLNSAPEDFVYHAKNGMDSKTLPNLVDWMRRCRLKVNQASYRRWLAIMRHYTSQRSTFNWTIAEAAFYEFRPMLYPKDLNVLPVFDLIQHVLATAPASDRIQQILFPSSMLESDAAEAFDLSIKYLQFFCEGQRSTAECLQETAQIVKTAKSCGLVTCQGVLVPVLKAIVRFKDFEAAETVFEEAGALLGQSGSLDLLQEYAFLNACEGSWGVVESTLERLHDVTRSRSQPIETGRLFDRLLLQHTAKNPAAQSFSFTVNAMKYTGLIPTNRVSSTLICACIRDGRYDLVVEWFRMIKDAFPRAGPGFRLQQRGWALADSLEAIGASSEEIAKVCQTLAHGCRKDPFGPGFREFAAELVRSDLCHRLCVASAQVPSGDVSDEDIRSMTLEQLLRYAYEFRTTSTTETLGSARIEGLKSDIAIQISAIVSLAKTFRGDMKSLFFGLKNQQDSLLRSRRSVNRDPHDVLKGILPEIFRHERSPGIGKLTKAVVEHYDQREKQGLLVDHSLLRHFVTSVGPEYPSEVLELVEAVHESAFVRGPTGVPFDTDIFKKWLYLVSMKGTVRQAVVALSSAIQCADQLEWSLHFHDLCQLVTQVGDRDHDAVWDEMRFPEEPVTLELRPLWHDLKQIWSDIGQKRIGTFRFPEWKRWEGDAR